MSFRLTFAMVAGCLLAHTAAPQSRPIVYKAAIAALAEEGDVRTSFENGLASKARSHEYDAMTTYDIEPDVEKLRGDKFMRELSSRGVQAVLMLRPASVGEGSSLESVRNEVSPRLYGDMQRFARSVSSTGPDDLIAVVHMAIYLLRGDDEAELISSGAVWLDEPVEDRAEGIDRLQDLVLANVDAVRPAIRRHLGLPELP
jgi:hypothetical protein